MIKQLLLLTVLYGQLSGQDFAIEGIILTQNAEELKETAVRGVYIDGLKEVAALQKRLEKEYLRRPFTEEVVQQIKAEIVSFYQETGRFVVAVRTPQKTDDSDVAIFEVKQARVGTITYKDNKWVSTATLKKQINVKEGELLSVDTLLNDTAWLNRNPFHRSEAVITPGSSPGYTDIEFITKDRFPFRVYVGGDNTGIKSTQEGRLFAGFNWGNAFGIGDLLSYQFTTAPDPHRFMSNFISYTSFLSWKHMLIVYGGYAEIHPDIPNFHSEGRNAQGSFRYVIPCKPLYKPFLQEFTFGADFKAINSDLFFLENFSRIPVTTKTATIAQLYLSYRFQDVFPKHNITFLLECLASPVQKWFPDQSQARYDELRPSAPVRYIYTRLSVGDLYEFAGTAIFSWLIRGQAASAPLLPSEQFGLGGYDTVRGYEERSFNADNILCVNAELHSPTISFIKKNRDKLFFLIFGDYGFGYNYDASTAQGFPKWQQLIGVGPGVRYTLLPYLTFRLDYGFQLNGIFGDHHFGRFHVGASLSY